MALNLSEPRIRRNSLSISSSNQNSRTYTPRRSQSAGPESHRYSSKGSSKTSTARTRRSAITRITVTDPKGKSLPRCNFLTSLLTSILRAIGTVAEMKTHDIRSLEAEYRHSVSLTLSLLSLSFLLPLLSLRDLMQRSSRPCWKLWILTRYPYTPSSFMYV
eukprot:1377797-Amorphochlora_amoeboformis.AAC.1